jgi:MSHA biogenesis protein MshQ
VRQPPCMRWLLLLIWLLIPSAQAATYAFQSDSFAWETAANAVIWEQNNTAYPRDDDKKVVNFSGGFTFKFGEVSYNAVRIHSNGALQFGADSAFHKVYTNTNLPVAGHDRLILMYWDDINPNSGGSVKYEQKGVAPNRYFVVSWENVPHYDLAGSYTFQVVLYENGEFKFQYGAGNAAGASATIGVEVDNSDYTLFSYNNAFGTNGSAIRWSRFSDSPAVSAFYAFEDSVWSGLPQEIFDRSAFERHGRRVGNAQVTNAGKVCQGAAIPNNNNAASIDAVNTAFDLDATLGNKGSVSFWYKSQNAWSGGGALNAQLMDATTVNNQWFFLTKDNSGKLRLVLTDAAGATVAVESAANSVAAGTWAHLAASWRLAAGGNQSVLRIFLNGALVASANVTTNGALPGSLGTLHLGDNRSNFIKAGATPGTANSANGTLDEVRVYNYEINSAQVLADMAATHGCELDVRVGGFNAVDVAADAISGKITSKTAGSAFNLDLVALNAAHDALAASFSGSVLVDLIANTSLDVALDGNNCPVSGAELGVGTVEMAGSRHTLSLPAVAEAWRDVRVRIRYPATGVASIAACSTDNFALKPASLAVAASDADWQTAGTARLLNTSGANGTPVHKAGQPFTLRVSGYNAANVVTANYSGSPTAEIECLLPAVCNLGVLSAGAFTANGGTLTSTTASYSEVGAINATFTDSVWGSVDSADSPASCAGFYACSSATAIGRFVPDHFDISANTAAFTPACGSFSYLGQPFDLGVAPDWRVTARNAGGGLTANYTDSLFKLAAATITGQAWSAASGTVSPVGSLPAVSVSDLGGGQASVLFSVGAASGGGGLVFARGTPSAPFDASLNLSASVADSEGVTYVGNPYLHSGIGFVGGQSGMRFGRLRLGNAAGSERVALPLPLTAQYWNGQGFVLNSVDICTVLPAPSLTFFAQSADNQLASGETTASFNSPLSAGKGNLSLTAPGIGNFGFLDLSVSAPAWLQYNWDGVDQGSDANLLDDNPRARAAFGKRSGADRVIMRREIF